MAGPAKVFLSEQAIKDLGMILQAFSSLIHTYRLPALVSSNRQREDVQINNYGERQKASFLL